LSDIREIPLPKFSLNDKKLLILKVDKIITTKSQNSTANTSALEAEIDQLVYQLYGLTEEEIKIIEDSVSS